MPGQSRLDVAVHARNLAQESRVVIAQCVLDLVGHGQLGGAQHARLPQLRDPRADERFALGTVGVGAQAVALLDQLRDRALGVEDALALHLGRVRGEHRSDVGMVERAHDVGGADVGLGEPLEGHGKRALAQRTALLLDVAQTHLLAILGDVGQVREVAERPDHADRLDHREVLQQPVERAAGLRVALEAKAHRQLAHPFDQLERLLSLLLADDVAEDSAEQPDVFDQRAVLVGGGGGRCLGHDSGVDEGGPGSRKPRKGKPSLDPAQGRHPCPRGRVCKDRAC